MRYLSKMFVLAVGLLAICVLSSAVYGDDVLVGSFKLPHPTQWNKAMLPAGDYSFKLARTQTNEKLVEIRGAKQSFTFLVNPEAACNTCRDSSLGLAVRGENRVVTSLDLVGFHVDFKPSKSVAEELAKVPSSSEQVAIQVTPN